MAINFYHHVALRNKSMLHSIEVRLITLGLTIFDRFSWSRQVHEVSRKIFLSIGAFKRVRPLYYSKYRSTNNPCCNIP